MEKKTTEKKAAKKKPVSEEVNQPVPAQENQKLTYEQLVGVANNLNQQCRQLYGALQEAKKIIAGFNEVKLITDLLDKADYFSDAFVDRCVDRLETAVNTMFDNADAKPEEPAAE